MRSKSPEETDEPSSSSTEEPTTTPLNQQSPSEKLKDEGAPHIPAPGIERSGQRAVKKEINPNTE